MTIASERTIKLLIALVVAEALWFGAMMSTDRDACAKYAGEEFAYGVSDIAYALAEKEVDQPVLVASESEEKYMRSDESAASDNADSDGIDLSYYADDGYIEVYGDYYGASNDIVPYDGSGYYDANLNGAWHSGADFAFSGGDGYDDGSGFSYTWYSENVLPGGGLNIPGRHVGDEGYVMDEGGNVCLASDYLPEGTVVNIPFGSGTGVVYDSGSGYDNLDVYVSW